MRKEPTHIGLMPKERPPAPPGPPRKRIKTPTESDPLTVTTMVYLCFGKQGIRDMITAVHDHDHWLSSLTKD